MNLLNRRGIELAANTVVILIISIAILSLGTVMTYNIVCQAEELTQSVDAQAEKRLEQLMNTGGIVVVADNEKTAKSQGSIICGSSPEEVASYAVAMRNTGTAPTDFVLVVREVRDPDANTVPITDWTFQSFLVNTPTPLAPGEKTSGNIIVKSPGNAMRGQYAITLAVEEITGASPNPTRAIETLYFIVG